MFESYHLRVGGITVFKVCARVRKTLLRKKVWALLGKVKETPKASVVSEGLVKSNSITPQLILSNQDSGLSEV